MAVPAYGQNQKAAPNYAQGHEVLSDPMQSNKGEGEATVLARGHGLEPLIAVYDTCLADLIEKFILAEKRSVHGLLRNIRVKEIEYTGPPELLRNCNRPEDYDWVRKYEQAFSEV